MRRFRLLASCLFVSLLSSLAYSQAAPPSADTMTLSSMPTKNYGSYTALFVQTGSAGSNSYIQFDLATLPVPAVVQKATLRLYVNQVTTAGSFDVYQLNTSWNESTLTYDNAPALGSSATGGNPAPFTTTSLNQFVLIDITPLVQQWVNGSLTNNGLALATTTSAGAIAFDSKEATLTSHQPELEIVLASTGGGGGVTSWNSRTGAVVPQLGDYSFSLLSGTLMDDQLSGTYMSNVLNFANSGNGYVGTSFTGGTFTGNGSGLTNVPVSAGSPFYVQNGTSQQASSNFNIDGNGTVGGTLTGTTAVNTSGTYQISGIPVVNIPNDGNGNTFIGGGSGASSSTGSAFNTFVGYQSGVSNTSGNYNTFLGWAAGDRNTTGVNNVFVGAYTGIAETTGANNAVVGTFSGDRITTGSENTLVGNDAGYVITTGSNNIIVGGEAGDNVTTGNYEILIGNSQETSAENNTIRIGTASRQTATYIAGINSTNISSGSPVYVDSNGMLGLGPSGGSGVTSFNGRTGAVVPAAGDYSFSLLSGTLADGQLGGTYSSALTLSNASNIIEGTFTGNGAGLTNVPVSAGSPNYIQNGTSQQTNASFNIDGNGMVGGTLTGTTTVNTTGTYQIGGTTVMSTTGTENIFLGVNASKSGSGQRNAFIGFDTGQTSSGDENTAVGFAAAEANGFTGTRNTILGALAANLLTAGSYNIILGYGAGATLSTGSSNIDVGNAAASASENNTIRIGTQGTQTGEQNSVYIAGITGSTVSSGLPVFVDSTGKLGTAGGLASGVTSFNGRTGAVVPASGDYSFSLISGTLGSSQLSGTYSSAVTLSNSGDVYSGASFSVTGNGTAAGTLTGTTAVNTGGSYQIGSSTVLSTAGTSSLYVGIGAGLGATGSSNTFVGIAAGGGPSSGGLNAFFGTWAGAENTSGTQNVFVGAGAGQQVTTGGFNTYVGYLSGGNATSTGANNTAVGYVAGDNITTGSNNILVGADAGNGTTTGGSNIYVGYTGGGTENNTIRIGTSGTGTGQQNTTYIAGISGNAISGGSPVYVTSNGMLGVGSSGGGGVSSWNGRTGAVVPASGDYSFSLISGTLGSSQLSGTYSSAVTLSNSGDVYSGASFSVTGNGTAAGTLTGTTAVNTGGSYQIGSSTVLSTAGTSSLYVGIGAGLGATGSSNTFVGIAAGGGPSSGGLNAFFGTWAGAENTSGTQNVFVGAGAGQQVTTGGFNTYVGYLSGGNATSTGANNTAVGYVAGDNITTGSNNILVGADAGNGTTTGGSNIYVGYTGGGTENNTIRIGTSGTGTGQQNTTYIAGISGNAISGGSPVYVTSNGMLGVGSSGGGGVSSWNGRTGAVVPASGDYSFSLISGIASISQIPSLASLYIQNTTTQQATSNFNISGNGTAAGMLTGTTAVNTGGYYQISGSNFLSGTSDGKSISLGIGTGAPISGGYNTFVGGSAGALTTGPSNTFVGALTGEKLTSGTANTFMGYEAGVAATTANYDIFIGQGAGTLVTTGSSDIYIGYTNGGTENNTIRIGTQGTGNGQQNTTFISGIRGATASGGIDVLVSSTGQLGTTTSSRRFKDNILDMGEASSKLFQLRPVTFFYKPQYDDGSHILQYGLIAEEVAKIYPDLVVYDKDGQPETIRYHLLTPMLLNEVQKQQKVVSAQQDVIATQQQQLNAALEKVDVQQQQIMSLQQSKESQQQQIESLQQRLQRVEALVGNLAKASSTGQTVAAQ